VSQFVCYTIGMSKLRKDRQLNEMEAPALLKAWKREREFTTELVAEILGVSCQSVNQWFARRARPNTYMQFMIEELTGKEVQPIHWLSGEEKAVLMGFKRQVRRLRNAEVKPPPSVLDKVAGRL